MSFGKRISTKSGYIYLQWLVIIILFVVNVSLIYQNITIKNQFSKKQFSEPDQETDSLRFERSLKNEMLLKKFPLEIHLDDFYFKEDFSHGFVNYYLIVAFDFTVCGRCLHDQLQIIHTVKSELKDKQICTLGIVGIINKKEESELISLYNEGLISFPCKTITTNQMVDLFHLDRERFIDTPFYILLSHQFQVLDVFKPTYMKTEGFKSWLRVLLRIEMI